MGDVRVTQAAVLVLCQSVPALTQWAQCWRIARADGEVLTFTEHDEAIIFMGETYSPLDSLSASATELSAMLGSVGNLDLAGVISDDAVTATDLLGGVYDGSEIEVWLVPWGNAGGEVPRRLAKGTAGNLSQGQTGFSMEVLTPGAKLQQQALTRTYTPGCRWQFGDANCTKDLTALTVTGTVSAAAVADARSQATKRAFFDTARTEADGVFNQGTLTWLTGANAGQATEIKDYDLATGGFILWTAMLFPIVAGATYRAVQGCDKSPARCKALANYVNFGGFPDVPGLDAISETPLVKD